MKEATGELNMTLVTVLAVAAILAFVVLFVPKILGNIEQNWSNAGSDCTYQQIKDGTCTPK